MDIAGDQHPMLGMTSSENWFQIHESEKRETGGKFTERANAGTSGGGAQLGERHAWPVGP
jgi:hypothetical protein